MGLEAGAGAKDSGCNFEELPLELQQVLRAQLCQPGDVSALMDMPSAFAVYVLQRRFEAEMSVTSISLAKRSFEDGWRPSRRAEKLRNLQRGQPGPR